MDVRLVNTQAPHKSDDPFGLFDDGATGQCLLGERPQLIAVDVVPLHQQDGRDVGEGLSNRQQLVGQRALCSGRRRGGVEEVDGPIGDSCHRTGKAWTETKPAATMAGPTTGQRAMIVSAPLT